LSVVERPRNHLRFFSAICSSLATRSIVQLSPQNKF
jgi:hypothetical protein